MRSGTIKRLSKKESENHKLPRDSRCVGGIGTLGQFPNSFVSHARKRSEDNRSGTKKKLPQRSHPPKTIVPTVTQLLSFQCDFSHALERQNQMFLNGWSGKSVC